MENENSSLFFPKLDFTHAKYVATKGFIEQEKSSKIIVVSVYMWLNMVQ